MAKIDQNGVIRELTEEELATLQANMPEAEATAEERMQALQRELDEIAAAIEKGAAL